VVVRPRQRTEIKPVDERADHSTDNHPNDYIPEMVTPITHAAKADPQRNHHHRSDRQEFPQMRPVVEQLHFGGDVNRQKDAHAHNACRVSGGKRVFAAKQIALSTSAYFVAIIGETNRWISRVRVNWSAERRVRSTQRKKIRPKTSNQGPHESRNHLRGGKELQDRQHRLMPVPETAHPDLNNCDQKNRP